MNINWYPGHMKKTLEAIEEQLKMVDVVINLLDARIPLSSTNPVLEEILKEKPTLILLNKSDLAESNKTKEWIEWFNSLDNTKALAWNSMIQTRDDEIIRQIEQLLKNKTNRLKDKGLEKYKYRVMIVGIPNVGKSTFINQLSKKKGTKVGNKPGVTKSNQWIRVHPKMDLLDTPGVLWPKLEPAIRGRHLAYTGSIKDEVMDVETLAFEFLKEGLDKFPEGIFKRYKITGFDGDALALMEEIGRKRGALIRGGEIDYTKVANLVLDEFRKGLLGRITLETVKDVENYE